MQRGWTKPAYDFVREVQRVPADDEVIYVELKVIEDVKALMREWQPRRVDTDSKALLKICGRYYN